MTGCTISPRSCDTAPFERKVESSGRCQVALTHIQWSVESWNPLRETEPTERGGSILMMPRRDFLKLVGCSAVSSLAGGLSQCQAGESVGSPAGSRANFFVILIDDMGYGDIGPFGSGLNRTPNLDRMAAEGRKLTSFYAAPVCTPSQAQMMTGCYLHSR
jgi:hypothetical protein